MRNLQLPKYANSAVLGEMGMRMVEKCISDDLKMIFRPVSKVDVGIDAEVEIVYDDEQCSGRLLALQIKCGESYFEEEKEDGYIIRIPNSTFNYWLKFSLPVIYIVCDPRSGEMLWHLISSDTAVRLKKSYKFLVSKTSKLNVDCKDEWKRIAEGKQVTDIVEIALFRFLHIKYYQKIDICITEPRDFYKLSYVGSFKGKKCWYMIGYFYDRYGFIELSDIQPYKELYEYNLRAMGWGKDDKLLLCIISKSRNALILDHSIVDFLTKNGIEYMRLVFNDTFFSFDELDDNNEFVQYFY